MNCTQRHPDLLDLDRALIVQRLWCEKILADIKPWEMRSSRTKVRGWIGLIEAGTGLICGKAELVDSLDPLAAEEYFKHIDKHQIPQGMPGVSEKWKFPWVLRNVVRFEKPIPYTHPKGADSQKRADAKYETKRSTKKRLSGYLEDEDADLLKEAASFEINGKN